MRKFFVGLLSFTVTFLLACAISFLFTITVFAARQDDHILTDPVAYTFTGRPGAGNLINQLRFPDVGAASADIVARAGALGIVSGPGGAFESGDFRPNDVVTREDALMFIVRAAGGSDRAAAAAADIVGTTPDVDFETILRLGYLQVAEEMGIITAAELGEAMADLPAAENGLVAPAVPGAAGADAFSRGGAATRQEIASWLVAGMEYVQEDIFDQPHIGRALNTFRDHLTVNPVHRQDVETLLRLNVISGTSSTEFGPGTNVSRLEMLGFIRNLDGLHYQTMGLSRRIGTVAHVWHEVYAETGSQIQWRHVHVRRADGTVDVLRSSIVQSPSPQEAEVDAVVLRGVQVGGLALLEVGDVIEYLVDEDGLIVWYVTVSSQAVRRTISARLQAIDMDRGVLTFTDANNNVLTFPMIAGMFGIRHDGVPFIRSDNTLVPAANFPIGSMYNVTLLGDIITDLEFVGDPVLHDELRGIVADNDPLFGSLTIIDENRRLRSFTYIPGLVTVERREFFDPRTQIGGIHQMFPGSNARAAHIADIRPGDIVVFRVADDDPFRIVHISAAENTTSRYGRIREINDGGGFFTMVMDFPGTTTNFYTFPDSILVLENGRPVHPNRIRPGDWARITVIRAVVGPGVLIESVIQINLDTGGHHISDILTGTIVGHNQAQNLLQLQHQRRLTPGGWTQHTPLSSLALSPNAQYFINGQPSTLAHVSRYFTRAGAVAYIAVENHFAGARAAVVSVRTGRDEVLLPNYVLSANPNGFSLLDWPREIPTDPGTIVVRDGRLVDPSHIHAADWTRVSINDARAAVVDISHPPVTSGVQIIRGRVMQVWPYQGFRVSAISIFDGFEWNYSPINREFTIDHDTLFFDEAGLWSIDDFLGWGPGSVLGNPDRPMAHAYTMVVDGAHVLRMYDWFDGGANTDRFPNPIPPFPESPGSLTVRGTITSVADGGIELRDVHLYNGHTGQWTLISNINATGTLEIQPNTIIAHQNRVIPPGQLQVGQQVLAFSPAPRPTTLAPEFEALALMIFVER